MKLFSKALCIAFVLTVIYSMLPFEAECREISEETFRLHILANSDSEEDQELKLKVRDRVLSFTDELFGSVKSREEAKALVSENLADITEAAQNEVYNNGYDYGVNAEVVNMYFSTRYYKSYTLPSGMYDALRITIGSGEGHNWWCVMYPQICIAASTDSDESAKEAFTDSQYEIVSGGGYEYKFKIVEIFEKLCSYFK